MERPTKFYPAPPRLSDFMRVPTAHNSSNATAQVVGSFAKMDWAVYQQYTLAHDLWREQITKIDAWSRNLGLQRRYMESFDTKLTTVVPTSMVGEKVPIETVTGLKGVTPDSNGIIVPYNIYAVHRPKSPHAPTVSEKPEKVKKSVARKALAAAKVEASAELLAAKKDALVSELPARKSNVARVENLRTQVPYHRAELSAIKHAGARSKAIQFGSTDLVTNLSADDGWKVVTRKKGDFIPATSMIQVHQGSETGAVLETHTLRGDPIVKDKSTSLVAIHRKPTQTAGGS